MNFKHNYEKLKNNVFTTIRRHDKPEYKVGNIEPIELQEKFLFNAEIIFKRKRFLYKIPTSILVADTWPFAKNRFEALDLIQSFYETPIKIYKERFVFLTLKKIIKAGMNIPVRNTTINQEYKELVKV